MFTADIAQHFGRSKWLKVACIVLLTCSWSGARSQRTYDRDALLRAVDKGNWNTTTAQLENFFSDQSVSINDSLSWNAQSVDSIYNYYENLAIVVSRFPDKNEVWRYWENWSNGLTKGSWQPRRHFKWKSRARKMANYHTMTMLCHELGHHLAERYEVERLELNCKEYQADLACVLLEMSLSQGKKGARRIRRYQDLLVSLNNEIPDHYTNTTVDLKANCEAMDVKFPSTPELMSLYASAFCERRRLLHADPGYGSPADLVNDLYLKEQNELLKKFPPVLSYDNELLHEHLHLHEIDFTSRFRRGIKEMEIWGTPMIYRLNGFFLDSSCSPRFYNMVFPEAVPKGAMIEVKVRDWDGVLTDRRQYYAEEDLNISDIRTSSMITYGDWGMALLQVETGSDGEELILYTDSDGLEMERKVVPIDVSEADFRLIGQKSGYV